MCGGAVISDIDPFVKRSRKVNANDLWNELDTYNRFAWNIKPPSPVRNRTTMNDYTPNSNQGDVKYNDPQPSPNLFSSLIVEDLMVLFIANENMM